MNLKYKNFTIFIPDNDYFVFVLLIASGNNLCVISHFLSPKMEGRQLRLSRLVLFVVASVVFQFLFSNDTPTKPHPR